MHSKKISDKRYMSLALKEAKKGLGKTSPNPCVGCVIVRDNRIVATGFHPAFGARHAETEALKKAGRDAKGAILYVTMEPCAHHGKTPPCTDALIRAGVKRVVVAMKDPNPVNNGKGISRLRKAGIKVATGVLKEGAIKLNRDFIYRMKRKRPCITLKMAQSLDGKIATRIGDSRWISSERSRQFVQSLRRKNDAVMIGINTLIRDNPRLSVRGSVRQPVKIIVDSALKTPSDAKVFGKNTKSKVIVATTVHSSKEKEVKLLKRGAQIVKTRADNKRVDITELMDKLMKMGISNILVEGGGELAASLFEKKLVDKLYLFIAPILIGGRSSVTSFEGNGIGHIKDALRLHDIKIRNFEDDILVEAML